MVVLHEKHERHEKPKIVFRAFRVFRGEQPSHIEYRIPFPIPEPRRVSSARLQRPFRARFLQFDVRCLALQNLQRDVDALFRFIRRHGADGHHIPRANGVPDEVQRLEGAQLPGRHRLDRHHRLFRAHE